MDDSSLINNPLNQTGGTGGNDALTGTNADDLLEAFGGNDALEGKAGDDVLNGGAGLDTVIYQFDPGFVSVDLNIGRANDGFSPFGVDTLSGIENVVGSEFGDIIVGNNRTNTLTGRDGNDNLRGAGGNDFILGGAGADDITGGRGNDTFFYLDPSEGGDTIGDFKVGRDKIQIVGAAFSGDLASGTLSSEAFFTGSAALDADDRFGYDSSTGEVLFDADGSGSGDAVTLAALFVNLPFTVENPADFSNTDITIL